LLRLSPVHQLHACSSIVSPRQSRGCANALKSQAMVQFHTNTFRTIFGRSCFYLSLLTRKRAVAAVAAQKGAAQKGAASQSQSPNFPKWIWEVAAAAAAATLGAEAEVEATMVGAAMTVLISANSK
jgi:hypothetical protein